MQLLSARQCWHDCFYTPANSTLQSSIEQATLGILSRPSSAVSGDWKKTKVGAGADFGGHRDDTGTLQHRIAAGLVQAAIGTLPEKLQQFGHVMYAPVNFISADYVENAIEMVARQAILQLGDAGELFHADIEVVEALALAQILRHRALMMRQPDPFPSVKALRDFCWDERGVRIDAQNFSRRWAGVIDSLRSRIDFVDMLALQPVAEVIKLHDDLHEENKKSAADAQEARWKALFARARGRWFPKKNVLFDFLY